MKILKKYTVDKRLFMLALLAVIFAIAGASIILTQHSQNVKGKEQSVANAAAEAAKQPKNSTALYFTDQKQLPTTYTPGQSLAFSFTITNHEGKDLDYPYTVTSNGVSAAAHSVNVKKNASLTVNQSISLPSDQDALTVVVKLTNQNKTIQFQLTKQ